MTYQEIKKALPPTHLVMVGQLKEAQYMQLPAFKDHCFRLKKWAYTSGEVKGYNPTTSTSYDLPPLIE